MKHLIFLISLLSIISCSKDNNEKLNIDTSIDLSVKDSYGVDLLNPNNPNTLDVDAIEIQYVSNGQAITVNNINLDYPKGFFIYKHNNEYRMRLFPNDDKDENYPITYIKWNGNDIDTLNCKIERNKNSQICKAVWFNGSIVWDDYNKERYFVIEKN